MLHINMMHLKKTRLFYGSYNIANYYRNYYLCVCCLSVDDATCISIPHVIMSLTP
jgi:hypothetical protein